LIAVHLLPGGSLVAIVITIVFPRSSLAGEYVNAKGDELTRDGVTEPLPFSVMVTLVALPPNVLPLTVTCVKPQMLPLVLLKARIGLFAHCPATSAEIIKKKPTA
jgi:hypothetical protein